MESLDDFLAHLVAAGTNGRADGRQQFLRLCMERPPHFAHGLLGYALERASPPGMDRSDGMTRRIDKQKWYTVSGAHRKEDAWLVGHESVTVRQCATGSISGSTSRGNVPQTTRACPPRVVDHGRVNLAEAGERQSPHSQAVEKQWMRRNTRGFTGIARSIVKGQGVFGRQLSTFDFRLPTVAMEDARAKGMAKPGNAGKKAAFQPYHTPTGDTVKSLVLQLLIVSALSMSLPLAFVQCGKMTADVHKQPCR